MKDVIPGELYAIPLFLSDVHDMHRVILNVLRGKDSQFAYCRIIADLGSAGFLIEVFTSLLGLLWRLPVKSSMKSRERLGHIRRSVCVLIWRSRLFNYT